MRTATRADKNLVIDILYSAYAANDTLLETIRSGSGTGKRLRMLLDYACEHTFDTGKIYISGNGLSAALILFPETRTISLNSLLRDLKMLCWIAGWKKAMRALSREKAIRKLLPHNGVYYIWFIGTISAAQGKGSGTRLMQDLIADCRTTNRTMYLEARIPENVEWYRQCGFHTYHELRLGNRVWHCMKRS
ncbi:GNAT family N-acetyltransferase [Chitinophaga solisilvae]|uniref:GNAT family N-acetyltransferase n=1 Tax=Chitinophaga solisilvae TaxID=1233460 RepID=UPI00136C649E|nr:GNAT family N-acetyltransferase [Chitinophaga solisilvae]